MNKKCGKSKKGLKVIIFLAVFLVVIGVFMLLWNAIIPSVIGWKAITYWQAAGLIILSKFLFGGIGRPGMMGMHGHFGRPDNPFMDKMKSLSPQERKEYIKQKMAEKFCKKEDDNNEQSSDLKAE